MLTEVYQYESPEGVVAYSLKYPHLRSLQELLDKAIHSSRGKLSEEAWDSFPPIPIWELENRAPLYWRARDFEILGVNYRLQVEEWLAELADRIKDKYRGRSRKGKRVAKEGSNRPLKEQTPQTEKDLQFPQSSGLTPPRSG